jgi:hypothetical protein
MTAESNNRRAKPKVPGRNLWFIFQGEAVATSDAKACAAECPRRPHFICTRLPRHKGDHVAHTFDDDTGRPVRVEEVWSP